MANAKFSLLLTILLSSTCVLYADEVPFLLLQSYGTARMISSLDTISEDRFQDIITEIVADQTLILFTSDYLSAQDLGHRSQDGLTCYENLSKLSDTFYAPSVQQPFETLSKLYAGKSVERYVTSAGDLNEKFEPNDKLVIVSLRGRQQGEDLCAYLASHDRVIAKTMNDLAAEKSVKFAYTGRRSGATTPTLSRKIRSAAPAEGATGTDNRQDNGPKITPSFWKNNNLLVYYTLLTKRVKKADEIIPLEKLTVTGDGTPILHAELVGGGLSIKLDLEQRSGYWFISKGFVNDSPFFGGESIGAPVGFSYHCSPAITFRLANSTDSQPTSITISGLQLEPLFDASSGPIAKYSRAQDCVGFTSAGIWAGLFVVIMLLSILTIGITWIMDIRTMDRFDDPKGKTITISASD